MFSTIGRIVVVAIGIIGNGTCVVCGASSTGDCSGLCGPPKMGFITSVGSVVEVVELPCSQFALFGQSHVCLSCVLTNIYIRKSKNKNVC